jgi:hypothetical protein
VRDARTPARAGLTEGQGGTFVEIEAGKAPESLRSKLEMAVLGRRIFYPLVEHPWRS